MLETNLLSLLNNKLKTSLTVLTKNIIFSELEVGAFSQLFGRLETFFALQYRC